MTCSLYTMQSIIVNSRLFVRTASQIIKKALTRVPAGYIMSVEKGKGVFHIYGYDCRLFSLPDRQNKDLPQHPAVPFKADL